MMNIISQLFSMLKFINIEFQKSIFLILSDLKVSFSYTGDIKKDVFHETRSYHGKRLQLLFLYDYVTQLVVDILLLHHVFLFQ